MLPDSIDMTDKESFNLDNIYHATLVKSQPKTNKKEEDLLFELFQHIFI